MAGFRKAKALQAALKMGIYGPAGSGKTFTALQIAEGLAAGTGRRIAFVDTERGTDFYCQAVKSRRVHPEAFDFDAIYTTAITEVTSAIKSLDPNVYGVVVIDSITHLWQAAQDAYSGRTTRAGTIPLQAWAQIKRPYKALVSMLLASPLHVIMCGREGNRWEEDDETGELKSSGKKMKAEGETAYEPHILLQMIPERNREGDTVIQCWAEKDRTGVLAGRTIRLWPSESANAAYELLVKPLLPLLGNEQASVDSASAAQTDAENLATQDADRTAKSAALLSEFTARIGLAKTKAELGEVGKSITKAIKDEMVPADLAELRVAYKAKEDGVR